MIRRRHRSSSTCPTAINANGKRSIAIPASSSAATPGATATRLNTPLFRQLIESRDAQFGRPGRRSLGRRHRRAGTHPAGVPDESGSMNVGIVCYASVGGSGVIASELGKTLASARPSCAHPEQRYPVQARRLPARALVPPGRNAHLPAVPGAALSSCRSPTRSCRCLEPSDWISCTPTTRFHMPPRPISRVRFSLRHSIACRRKSSRRCMAPTSRCSAATRHTRKQSHSAFEQSDGVTAVSESLKADTERQLRLDCEIRVIPNFLDCSVHRRLAVPDLRHRFCTRRREDRDPRLELSSGQASRRAVIDVFSRIRREVPARAADGR